jgi:hypothetical protein
MMLRAGWRGWWRSWQGKQLANGSWQLATDRVFKMHACAFDQAKSWLAANEREKREFSLLVSTI